MMTDELIRQIARGVTPVRILPSTPRRFLSWFGAAILSVATGVVLIGLRPDVLRGTTTLQFALNCVVILLITVLSVVAASMKSIPDTTRSVLVLIPPLSAVFIWLVLLATQGRLVFATGPHHYSAGHGFGCIRDILVLGAIPGAFLFFLVRRAAPVALGWSGLLVMLTLASIGALGLQFTCTNDDPLHLFAWHFLPVLVIAVSGIVLGRRLLRW